MTLSFCVSVLALAASVRAHTGFWARGMYCLGGNTGTDDQNSNAIVQPLYQLPFNQWWMHHSNNCDQFPPAAGEILNIPAGGSFSGEMATNRGSTSLAFAGKYVGDWPDGVEAPIFPSDGGCIGQPLIHAKNENDAAGTAMAIAYVSELSQVTPQNLAVFTVRYHTPWKRVVSYDVPQAMPACPPGGCICAWGWVPNHCGQPNMYMQPFKCNVTGATSTTPIAPPQPAVWCEGNPSACTKGSKQMIYMNQLEGNNIDPNTGEYQADGQTLSPGYNMKLGWADGAQNDIFGGTPSPSPTTTTTSTTSTSTTTTTTTSTTPTASTTSPSTTTTTSTGTTTTTSTSSTTTTTTTTSHTTSSFTSTGNNNGGGVPPNQPQPSTTSTTISKIYTKPAPPSTASSSKPTLHTTYSKRPSHTTYSKYTSHTTSSMYPSHSGKPGHCSNKSRREAAKRHLEAARRKRVAIAPHHGGIN